MIYRLAKKKNLKAEINVVPYIDVMLVLLIIFMVLSPLLIQGIEVNLPETDTTKMSVQNEPLVISINSDGNYFINVGDESLPINLEELKRKSISSLCPVVQGPTLSRSNDVFGCKCSKCQLYHALSTFISV